MRKKGVFLAALAAALTVLGALVFYSERFMWSGIIAILGQASPFIMMTVIAIAAIMAILSLFFGRRKPWQSIVLMIIGMFFIGLEIYIYSQTADSINYFTREFISALAFTAGVAILAFLLFYFPKTRIFASRALKLTFLIVLCSAFLISQFSLLPNSITTTPVVYAVGDEYQIVFTSAVKGTAWVNINGSEYNDTYAGSRVSEDTVHKICVPMNELDSAGSYTVFTRAMYFRGPYCALQGNTISQSFAWRGVNEADGLDYYVISDTHTAVDGPAKTASYFGDKLDFLICCGDTANWLDTTDDASYVLRLAGQITLGAVPVVYARGNHETKGRIADRFYRYAAADGQKFFYTFRLKSIWGIVLDMGEDHGDDWSEFYDSSRFDEYREEQTEFLDSVIADAAGEYDAADVNYRIAVCHIPITFKYSDDHAGAYKDAWIERLEKMKLTVLFGGHRHQLIYIDPTFAKGTELKYHKAYAGYDAEKADGYATGSIIPSVLVSRMSDVQQTSVKDVTGGTKFIGLAVSSDGQNTTMRFTDINGKAVNIMSPWFKDIDYGDKIVIPNK